MTFCHHVLGVCKVILQDAASKNLVLCDRDVIDHTVPQLSHFFLISRALTMAAYRPLSHLICKTTQYREYKYAHTKGEKN